MQAGPTHVPGRIEPGDLVMRQPGVAEFAGG